MVSGFQTLSEGRNTTDVASIYLRSDLQWTVRCATRQQQP
jgi:hypothetical protein